MRKISLLAIVLLIVGTVLVGCGGNNYNKEQEVKDKTEQEVEDKKEQEVKDKKANPKFEVTIDDIFTLGTRGDGDMLVVNLIVKNNSEKYLKSQRAEYSLQATLDGEDLEHGYIYRDNPYYLKETRIKPGESELVQSIFSLKNIDYDDDSAIEFVSTTRDLVDHEEIVVLEETVNMSDVDMVKSESEIEVTLDNVTVTDDGAGTNLLVLDYNFTNNSDNPKSFVGAVKSNVLQDGVLLSRSYLPNNHPMVDEAKDNYDCEIRSGASVPVRCVYELHGDSNVEIQLIDTYSFDLAVIFDTEIEVATAESENASRGVEEKNPFHHN